MCNETEMISMCKATASCGMSFNVKQMLLQENNNRVEPYNFLGNFSWHKAKASASFYGVEGKDYSSWRRKDNITNLYKIE